MILSTEAGNAQAQDGADSTAASDAATTDSADTADPAATDDGEARTDDGGATDDGAATTDDGAAKTDAAANDDHVDTGEDPASPVRDAVGDTFSDHITLDGEQIPCVFRITSTDAGSPTVEIGTGSSASSIDSASAGDLSFPESVTHNSMTYAVTRVGDNAFNGCTAITSTGLAGNKTIRSLGDSCYFHCDALTHTGLEQNDSVEACDGANTFFSCTKLISTGFETNKTCRNVVRYEFRMCPALKTTGLEENTTVSTIDAFAFDTCNMLGADPTDAVNMGDLVLNQPVDAETGDKVQLVLGFQGDQADGQCFASTKPTSLYLLCDKDMLKMQDDALKDSAITKLYVNATWLGTDSFTNGGKTFSVSDGTLIVMDPLRSAGDVSRSKNTSDAASVQVTVNAPIEVTITGAKTGRLWSGTLGTDAGPEQKVTANIPQGSSLTSSADTLTVTSTTRAVYPDGAKTHDYNTATCTPATCDMPAVTYSVKFDANGGDGKIDPQIMTYDVAAPLSADTPEREYYDFTGWNTARSGGGTAFAHSDQVQNLRNLENDSITLYAQWKTNVSVSVTFHAQSSEVDGADGTTSLAGCGLELYASSDDAKPFWTGETARDGTASVDNLVPGDYHLHSTRAPAGYEIMRLDRTFTIDESGRFNPTNASGAEVSAAQGAPNILNLNFSKAPALPLTGRRELAWPLLVVAGTVSVALSLAYLRARKMAGR